MPLVANSKLPTFDRLKREGDSFRIGYKQFNLIDSEGEHRGLPIII